MLNFFKNRKGPTVAVVNDVQQYLHVMNRQDRIIERQERMILLLVDALVGRHSPRVAMKQHIIDGAVPVSQTSPEGLTDEQVAADLEAMSNGQ